MWQFSRAVDGISDACRKLDLPITGGNVSLYNETDGEAIHPTPVIGVVGVIENSKRVLSRVFKNQGSVIVLLGQSDTDPSGTDLGGSEYLKVIYGLVRGRPPELDLVLERSLQRLLVEVISDGLLESAHDCSDGGLAVTLAECCFESGQIGAEVTMSAETIDGQSDLCIAATLFGETASRVIVSVKESKVDEVITKAAAAGVPSSVIGRTGGSAIRVSVDGSNVIDIALAEAEQFWNEGFSRHFNSLAA
jgi:phosphoribosylformylglycinamidine synthase